MSLPVIQLENLVFAWPGQPSLLDIEHFTLAAGERVFLKGPSGSGKTTLLGLLGGVQLPASGRIQLLCQDLPRLSGSPRDRFRAAHSGYIFPMFNLLPYLSVLENISLPCRFSAMRRRRAIQRHGGVEAAARHLLTHLGLDRPELLRRAVTELSIGQQQRVAAARALIGSPELVIADEPTSALAADAREASLNRRLVECQAPAAARLSA